MANVSVKGSEIVMCLLGWHDHGAHGDDLLGILTRRSFEEAAQATGTAVVWTNDPKGADYLLVGGGTLLGFDTMDIVRLIREMGVPFSIFGTGFRREKRDIGRENIAKLHWMVENADFIFLRGYLSQQFCVHSEIHETEVIGDPAIQFVPIDSPSDNRKYTKVGVSIRSMGKTNEPQYVDNGRVVDIVSEICCFLCEEGPSMFFFLDLCENEHDSDIEAILRVSRNLPPEVPYKILPFETGTLEIFSVLNHMDYIISQRLHPSIIGWTLGIPHLGLDYQNGKTADFFTTIGMTEFCLRTDDFSMGTYVNAYKRLRQDVSTIRMQSQRSIDYWRARQCCAARRIIEHVVPSLQMRDR